MTRLDLATKLSLRMNVSKGEADRYLLSFLNAIVTGLETGDRVVVQGFGSFKVKHYEDRYCKKPVTGELIHIPVRNKPVFSPGKELREMVNRPSKTVRSMDATPEQIAFFVQARE